MAPPTQATAIISASGSNFLFSPWESEFLVSSEDFRSPAAHDVTQGPGFGWSLATVINWNHEPVDSAGQAELESELDRHISDFVARGDDVWTEDFLNVIIVSMRNTTDQIPKKYKSSVVFSTQHSLPDGPYAFHSSSGRISRVTRLVDDTHNAFVGTCDSEKSFTTGLPILDSFRWLKCEGKIAIPPRAFQSSTQGVPESSLGLRFAVKDLIDVSGLETSCGNQAWRAHYPPKDKSATCIENLLSNGAVLLGKTKLTQFADGQDPSEWYDYQPPLNPRGDMFQKPSSSSTGSAVACAAYPWLDFTIGTDTGGSIRHPAGVNGIYGFRPSLGWVDDSGVFSVTKRLDTVGVFARSAFVLEAASIAMKGSLPPTISTPRKKRYKLLYPQRAQGTPPEKSLRWFPYQNEPGVAPEAEKELDLFVEKLESHLSCSRTTLNIEDLWRDTRPAGQPESLDEATGSIYTRLVYYNNIRDNIDPFIETYAEKNGGRKPWIDPIVRARFDAARKDISSSDHEAALKSADVFGNWVDEVLFKTDDEDEIPLLIFPQSFGLPDYRDSSPAAHRNGGKLFWDAFSVYSLSYLGGGPDVTVPVSEVPFESRHTGIEEWLPVSMSILGRKGTDAALLGLLSDLEAAGKLKAVATGRRMFPVEKT